MRYFTISTKPADGLAPPIEETSANTVITSSYGQEPAELMVVVRKNGGFAWASHNQYSSTPPTFPMRHWLLFSFMCICFILFHKLRILSSKLNGMKKWYKTNN